MSVREYFCLVNIEIATKEGVKKEVRKAEIDMDPDRDNVEGLWYAAMAYVKDQIRRYESGVEPEDITFTGFNFWKAELPR